MNDNNIGVEEVKEISIALVSAIPANLSAVARLRWSHSKDLLIRKVQDILRDDGSREVEQVSREWEELYGDLGLKKNFSNLLIPKKPVGFNRLMIRAVDLSDDEILRVCERTFKTEYHPLGEFGDTLKEVTRHELRPNGDYAFWLRDLTESELPPPEYRPPLMTPPMIFPERLLLELKYYRETGGHLDNEKVTCCFGTKHSEGDERPVICWRRGALHVFWQASQFTEILMSCSPYWTREMSL